MPDLDYPFKESALINPRIDPNLPKITPSNLEALTCSHRYHTLFVEKRGWPARDVQPALRFGNALHEVLKQVYDPRYAKTASPDVLSEDATLATGDKPNLSNLSAQAAVAFRAYRFQDVPTRQKEEERCKRIVKKYVESNSDEEGVHTLAVERQGSFPIHYHGKPLFNLTAKLDRVFYSDDDPTRLVVRDYKSVQSGAQPQISLTKAFINLWVAKLLYPGFKSYALQLEFIDEDGRVERETIFGSELLGLHKMVMDQIARVLLATKHPKEPGEQCIFCPLRETCTAVAAQPPYPHAISLPIAQNVL